jgi:hypothetical protein
LGDRNHWTLPAVAPRSYIRPDACTQAIDPAAIAGSGASGLIKRTDSR